ncbi:MAG: 30S ribosomal protein S1, partial [Planctomycetota bacterium]
MGSEATLTGLYEDSIKNFELETILRGRVINIVNQDVIVDVGYKSEGVIPLMEFLEESETAPKIGEDIDVLLEALEDESGLIVLSKKKADRIKGWEKIVSTHKEGDKVKGKVIRKIKGGLLVDIGVPVFLPASQISIRRTGDISEYIGQDLECRIIKIDEARMNIVVSRRKIIEEEREAQKKELLKIIEEGQLREGVVKNLADFGAFVDLGGIDGLLHITDMSWGRISHPSEMLNINDKVEVKILKIDREKERIALGLKQKSESPWKDVEKKYPISRHVNGEVVNVMSYGAFVKLEEGIEGLVHISEMSWTRRITHPSELVKIGDHVEVVILDINREKQEISLGMKQTESNPWDSVEDRYKIGTIVNGKVRNLTNYGAFIEIEEGIDGLLHISDMSWTKKISHPSEVLKKGQEIKAQVLHVDQEKKRVALGMKQLEQDPWESVIPEKYQPGKVTHGKVTKITNFGIFVELEDNLEGLLHISELSDKKIKTPEEIEKIVNVGDMVNVRILRVEKEERKIGLSLVKEISLFVGFPFSSGFRSNWL